MAYPELSLSPEQAEEFPGEDLGRFALAWLEFRRSSPCTTERRSFPYFTAPGEDSMGEADVLYGPDRELAYKKLMWAFRKCQRSRVFDPYFDPAHRQYYPAATIPGLVLLKEWASERVAMPGLYTGSLRTVKPEAYDEVWILEEDAKAVPADPVGNVRHVPVLAPSGRLRELRKAMRDAGRWDPDGFMETYAPAYLREMLRPGAYAALRELHGKTGSLAVLCTSRCRDEDLSHRRLVRMVLDTMSEGGEENAEQDA